MQGSLVMHFIQSAMLASTIAFRRESSDDNVDIGALCTIDKGVTGDTTIGEGTKIDNQVHVGHDTIIGKKC
jgi:acyl-[acyl carrier protein]--UDP-N-acetylglucosamine O-acyltransferase